MTTADKTEVLAAINKLGRRVTVSDVAAQTGLALHNTTLLLNRVAAETRGNLEVSDGGTIVYSFAPNFESSYALHGILRATQDAARKLFHFLYFLLRVSFGVTLIASLITIALLLVFVVIQVVNKGSDGNSGDGAGFNLGWFDINDFGSFFTWQIAAHQYGNDWEAYTRGDYLAPGDRPEHQSFLLNCYSFLFGDGNPNEKFSERTWQIIAERIRKNGGVTTKEELACFTGADPNREYDALPVLVRFDGVPSVTETGNIVYAFPSLQVTAVGTDASVVPNTLEEKRWQFSTRSFDELAIVAAFGLLNLVGAVTLLAVPAKVANLHRFEPLIHWLIAYGVFFLFFPILRFAVLRVVNIFIDIRNERRAKNVQLLLDASPELATKLAEAQQLAIAMHQITSEQIVYTTSSDILDQQFDDQSPRA